MNNDKPFISIIVPVYNIQEYLETCIRSTINQTFTNMELILVDDGSSDQSGDICDKFAAMDDRIRVTHTKNRGLVSARKKGLQLAKGKYIGFVDGDDWVDDNMLSAMCQQAQKTGADIVICDVMKETPNGKETMDQNISGGEYDKYLLTQNIYPHMIYTGDFFEFGLLPCIWNKIYKTELIKEIYNLINEQISIGEDLCCTYRALYDASKIVYLKGEYLYHYRQRPDSMMKKSYVDNMDKLLLMLNFFSNQFSGAEQYIRTQIQYYNVLIISNIVLEVYGISSKEKFKYKNEYIRKLRQENLVQTLMAESIHMELPNLQHAIMNYLREYNFLSYLKMIVFIVMEYMKSRK